MTDEKYSKWGMLRASDVDSVIANYSSQIMDWGYVSCPLGSANEGRPDGTRFGGLSRLSNNTVTLTAMNPSKLLDESFSKSYYDRDTALGLSE